jgi:hypothetical protein
MNHCAPHVNRSGVRTRRLESLINQVSQPHPVFLMRARLEHPIVYFLIVSTVGASDIKVKANRGSADPGR